LLQKSARPSTPSHLSLDLRNTFLVLRSEQSYLQNLGGYISGLSFYLPTGFKKQLTAGQSEEAREKILRLTFDRYEIEGEVYVS
jgi:hypothetical protein